MKRTLIGILVSVSTLASAQTDKAVASNASVNQMRVVFSGGTTKYYNTDDVASVRVSDGTIMIDDYVNSNVAKIDFRKGVNVTNSTVNILKSEGWLNSAYIIFEQIDGATFKVLCDDQEIDQPLIRYYDTYTYYEAVEDEQLQVTWEKKTLSKVVRADALGLTAGEHTLKVCAVSGSTESSYSEVNLTVRSYDRSGFAFTGATTPGAYNADGTLKNGALVLYLTQNNKSTLTATIGSTTYTGIQAITQAIKTKNTGTTPIAIRIVGTVKSESNDLSCSDMKSAYALGIKEASYVTIEGVGHDATLYGAGVAAFKSDYIEVSNLGLVKWGGGKDGDGVSVKESSYVWVHNNDVYYGNAGSDGDQVKGDGSMDLKDDANHMTISYNHFWDSGKMSLCGMKDESGPNYITYHHNWFDHSDSRHPRIRTMSVHVYNNYFDGNAKYGIGVTMGASCFAEGNFFRNAHDPMMSSKQGTDATGSGTFSGEAGGSIKAYNNLFVQNNTNGVKFQYITNKYDYTNNKELGEYQEWTEIVGTDNGDGTWTIYDSEVSSSKNTISTNSLIAIEDAVLKDGGYYQISKSKTGFYIDVPANVTKVIVRAKCGSSNKTGTANMLSVDGQNVAINMADDYANYEVELNKTKDATIEISNVHNSNSLNIKEIKVLATSGWETKLTSGADLSNIDAYEVDSRTQTIPSTVKTKSGDYTYDNFDTTLGDNGLGLSNMPTEPDVAKADVIELSGRHNADLVWSFTNSTDDADYAVNTALNNALVAYTTGMTNIQGTDLIDTGNNNEGSDASEDNNDNSEEENGDNGVAIITFTKTEASDSRLTYTTTKKYDTAQTYDEVEYTYGVKLNSTGTMTLTLEAEYTVKFVMGTDKSGYTKGLKIDDVVVSPIDNVVTSTLGIGTHTIINGGSETSVFLVILSK